jgi:hypothetical protein
VPDHRRDPIVSGRKATSWTLTLLAALAGASSARAQEPESQPLPQAPPGVHAQPPKKGQEAGQMPHVQPMTPDQSKMVHLHHEQPATGMFGPYPLTREASGTSWQPESSTHEGLHFVEGRWITMVHAWATGVWDDQGGPRGGEKFYGANMAMARTHGPLGPGVAGLRVMLSAEPATIGKEGYPLLLQTGESADGVTPLIDRQHPHDLTMELATSYSMNPDPNSSIFVYAGLPGEPALGPPVYMHRFSGETFPDAPIGHHWLDATHITYGVLTGGLVDGPWKFEGSLFRGREPDQNRTDIETGKLDSHSFRLSDNPSPDVAAQISFGRIHSPEAIEPDVNVDRFTASVMVNSARGGGQMQSTLAWGQNHETPGSTLNAYLLESTAKTGRSTWMTRIESVEKDHLFPSSDPRAATVYKVGKLSLGYTFDAWTRGPVRVAIGGLGSLSKVPGDLNSVYGGKNPLGGMVFVRAVLQDPGAHGKVKM